MHTTTQTDIKSTEPTDGNGEQETQHENQPTTGTVTTDDASVHYKRSTVRAIPTSWIENAGHDACGHFVSADPGHPDSRRFYAIQSTVEDRQRIEYTTEGHRVTESRALLVRYSDAAGETAFIRSYDATTTDSGHVVPTVVAESGPEHWPVTLCMTDRLIGSETVSEPREGDAARVRKLYAGVDLPTEEIEVTA